MGENDEKGATETTSSSEGKGAAGDLSQEDIEKAVEAIYTYAGALLRAGRSEDEVEDALVEKGIERNTAMVVVRKLTSARASTEKSNDRDKGFSDMMIGGLIAGVGIVITAITYSAASEGGGRYVIAWGAIIFGAIRFFRGLSRMGS